MHEIIFKWTLFCTSSKDSERDIQIQNIADIIIFTLLYNKFNKYIQIMKTFLEYFLKFLFVTIKWFLACFMKFMWISGKGSFE